MLTKQINNYNSQSSTAGNNYYLEQSIYRLGDVLAEIAKECICKHIGRKSEEQKFTVAKSEKIEIG